MVGLDGMVLSGIGSARRDGDRNVRRHEHHKAQR